MIFSKSMHWGRHAAERKAFLLDQLRKRNPEPATYIIVAAREPNLFEIYNDLMFLNSKLNTDDTEILGIGYGYQDALECAKDMVLEVLHKSNT